MLRSALYICVTTTVLSVGCAQPQSQQCGTTGVWCKEGFICTKDLTSCIDPAVTLCGDGNVDGDPDPLKNEECDDGNLKNNDSCNSNCKLPTCGDGLTNDSIGEACDGGAGASPGHARATATCDTDCSVPVCGDGVTNESFGESCDPGTFCAEPGANPPTTQTLTACTTDAQCAGIGDGKCLPRDQECCTSECKSPFCGNGKTDLKCTSAGLPPEVCDDGKQCAGSGLDCTETGVCADGTACQTSDGDGCSAACISKEVCGDRVTNEAPHTMLTKHARHIRKPDGTVDTIAVGVTLTADDGEVAVEACDDGNTDDGDGCSSDCLSEEKCGDGWFNNYDHTPVGGSPVPAEVCDDGNQAAKDGCSPDCQTTERCGNGKKDDQSEECDPGMLCADNMTPCVCPNLEQLEQSAQLQTGCTSAPECASIGDRTCVPRSTATCSKSCQEIFCGNKRTDEGEDCDDDDTEKGTVARPADSNTNACHDNCRWNLCGDGIPSTEEDLAHNVPLQVCDNLGGGDSPTCDSDCTERKCGDNYINYKSGEFCDSGPGLGPNTTPEASDCDADCTFPLCGDGHVNPLAKGEVCDDKNTDDGDGCAANCTSKELCGDGITNKNAAIPEVCDKGGLCEDGVTPCTMKATDCPVGGGTFAKCLPQEGAGCSADCGSLEVCGDKIITAYPHANKNGPSWPAETCDDGNVRQEDGCDQQCVLEPGWACPDVGDPCLEVCGDGLVVGLETCDEGNRAASGGCTSCATQTGWDCPAARVQGESAKQGGLCTPICGDRRIRGGETCDDGNQDPLDGCDATCAKEAGWNCPVADNLGGGCTSICGDSLVVGGEECDDSARIPGDGCDSNCRIEDGYACPQVGGVVVGGACFAVCGDGSVHGNETCDEGASPASGGCTTCQAQVGWTCPTVPGGLCRPTCSDGLIKGGETCDDKNLSSGDGCNGLCQLELGYTCATPGQACAPTCGDSILRGAETCDEGTTPASGGCVACQTQVGYTCTTPGQACTPICGDGLKVAAEACDDGVNNSNSGDCTRACVKATCSDAFTHSVTLVAGGPVETDLNCGAGAGGPAACAKCALTKLCQQDSDCTSNFCSPIGNRCEVPTRQPDEVRMHAGGGPLEFDVSYVLGNDSHQTVDTFSISAASCGTATYDQGFGTITFDPNAGVSPCAPPANSPPTQYKSTFTYKVCPPAPNDTTPALCSAPATVKVVINRDPVLTFQSGCVAVGTPSTQINVASAFYDADGNPLDNASILPTSVDAGIANVSASVVTWEPTNPDLPGEYTITIPGCDNVTNLPEDSVADAIGCSEANWVVRWSEAPHLASIADASAYTVVTGSDLSINAYGAGAHFIEDFPSDVAILTAGFANGPFSTSVTTPQGGTCTFNSGTAVVGDETLDFHASGFIGSDACFVQVCEVCSGIQICSVTRVPYNVRPAFFAPTITSGSTALIAENAAISTIVYQATATNPDPGAVIVWSLSGADAAFFDIGAASGELTLKASANFEAKSVYAISVVATVGGSVSSSKSVTVSVTNVNEAPTVTSSASGAIAENALTSTTAYTATASDPDAGDQITWSLTGADAASLNISADGTVRLNASANFEAKASYVVNVVATDGGSLTATKAVTISVTDVNDAPTAVADNASTPEDVPLVLPAATLLANDIDVDAPANVLTITGVGGSVNGGVSLNGTTVTFTPTQDYSGAASFTYTISDGAGGSSTATVSVTVTSVNDAPSRTAGATANLTMLEDGVATTLGLGTLAYSVGPASESAQTLTYTVTAVPSAALGHVTLADGTTFVTAQSYSLAQLQGMKFLPIATANGGPATFSWNVVDNGGTANGGVDTLGQSLTITVTSVNDAPTRTAGAVSNFVVLQNAPATTLGLATLAYATGPADESAQTLTYTVTSVPPGSLGNVTLSDGTTFVSTTTSYTLAQVQGMKFLAANNANGGPGTFSWTVVDNGGTANGGADTLTESLTVSITAVNSAPIRSAGTVANLTLNEDAVATTLGLTGLTYTPGPANESAQTLTYAVTAIPSASLGHVTLSDGTTFVTAQSYTLAQIQGMKFLPVANANGGPATFTWRIVDSGGTTNGGIDTLNESITINVTPVNDAPTRTAGSVANLTVNEDAAATTLGLGTLAYSTGPANESGQTLTYTVTVLPSALLGNVTLSDGTTVVTTATTYTLAELQGMKFVAGADANGGPGTFSFNVSDDGTNANGGVDTLGQSLTITVNSVNDIPVRNGGTVAALTMLEEGAATSLGLGGLSYATGPTNESAQTVTYTVTAVPAATIGHVTLSDGTTFVTATTYTLAQLQGMKFLPVADGNGGPATFSWNVTDSGGTSNGGVATLGESLTVTVTAVNDPPARTAGNTNNLTINEDASATTLGLAGITFSTGPSNESAQTLTYTVTAVPAPALGNVTLTNGTTVVAVSTAYTLAELQGMKFVAAANAAGGPATFSFNVSDNGGTANAGNDTLGQSLTISVTAVNDAPVLSAATPVLSSELKNAGAPSGTVGTLVSALVDIGGTLSNVTDVDASPVTGIAIIAADTGHGNWHFSTNNGTNWTALGSVADNSARVLAADANTRVYFEPDANWSGSLSTAITFRAWDRSSSSNGNASVATNGASHGGATAFSTVSSTASLTVDNANAAPVLDASKSPVLVAQNEDAGAPSGVVGTLVSSLVDIGGTLGNVTDGDSSPVTGIAVTSVDTTNGTWHFSTNGGTSWTALGTPATATSRLLAADASTRIYFQPNAEFSGAGGTVTFRAWDRSSGANGTVIDTSTAGGTTPYSTVTDTASVAVNSVNDAPTRTAGSVANLTLNEDAVATTLGFSGLAYSTGPANESAQSLTYTVTAIPSAALGHVTLIDGTTFVTATTYTLAEIQGMKFLPVADANGGPATFSWNVTDNGGTANGGIDTLGQSLTITVTAVNDIPVRTAGTVANLTVLEDAAVTSLGLGALAYSTGPSDESAQTLAYAVTAVPSNAIGTIVLADGTTPVTLSNYSLAQIQGMKFLPIANGNGGPATFSWNVTDNGGSTNGGVDTLGQSLTITVTSVNDVPTPTAGVVANLTVLEDAVATTLGLTGLTYSPGPSNESAQTLTYTVTAVPSALLGNVVLADGTTVVTTGTYTLAELQGMKFLPTANAWGGNQSFSWTVSDNGGVANGGVDTLSDSIIFTVTSVNDAPALDNTKTPGPIAFGNATPVGNVGTLVSSLVDFASPSGQVDNVTDADSGAVLGIAITAATEVNGTWYYSLDGGTVWNTLGTASAAASVFLAADANTQLYFKRTTSGADSFTFRAWDQSTGTNGNTGDTSTNGAATPYSSATDTCAAGDS